MSIQRTSELRAVCHTRLKNDLEELGRLASLVGPRRLRVEVQRFGDRIRSVTLRFAAVRTAFRDQRTGRIVIRRAQVVAKIRFDAALFPYPLAPPEVRLSYPGLPAGLQPFLGGLFWHTGQVLPEDIARLLRRLEEWT